MEFITGLKQQEEAELEDLLKAEEGTTIILEGAVHSIRDMGEIAFVILRKREGLIQTVWEEGKTDMELSEIREGDYTPYHRSEDVWCFGELQGQEFL